MAVFSVFCSVHPLIRICLPPFIRLSVLRKSNRVNWLWCGVREAHGKDSAPLAGCLMSHEAGWYPQLGPVALKQLFTFLLMHLCSCSAPHTVCNPRGTAFSLCLGNLTLHQAVRSTEQPHLSLLSLPPWACSALSPHGNFPHILHPTCLGRSPRAANSVSVSTIF